MTTTTTTAAPSVLVGHEAVEDAAELTSGDGTTTLFVVTSSLVAPRALRAWLGDRHPDRALPDEIVPVDEIPGGAVGPDAEALAGLREDRARRHATYAAPATATEEYLAALWEDLLGIEGVGADDDLFGIGGHSMLAVRIRRAVGRDLGVAVPPEELFVNSVLREQAAAIDELRAAAEADPDGTGT